jgi:hypothetical protein
MRWLAVTVALLTASAGLVAGIYFRDRNPSPWLPPSRTVAQHDAQTIAHQLAGGRCDGDCEALLLSEPQPETWLAKLSVQSTTQCVYIYLQSFAYDPAHGVTGVRDVRCPPPSSSSGGAAG